ncbi:hypothetical protein GJAV_G00215530 [Gymnothorax javanicus]|nr:hypothetical protein GJAV_G00215530 [Gymnothorax javanicus]
MPHSWTSTMATAPPFTAFPQPPSYEETLVAPPPLIYQAGPPPSQGYHSGLPPPQGYTSGLPSPQGYAAGLPSPQGYAAGPPLHQGYASGPPPPPGYAKVPQGPYPPPPANVPVSNNVVPMQTVFVQPGMVFGDRPVHVHCSKCAQLVQTRTEHHSGTMTWISCLALSFLGCIYGCCLIPFCVDSLKDVQHFCPNCNGLLGNYKRL